jgi:hypothetical protein
LGRDRGWKVLQWVEELVRMLRILPGGLILCLVVTLPELTLLFLLLGG